MARGNLRTPVKQRGGRSSKSGSTGSEGNGGSSGSQSWFPTKEELRGGHVGRPVIAGDGKLHVHVLPYCTDMRACAYELCLEVGRVLSII